MNGPHDSHLDLALLLFSVADVHFGIDAEQVAGVDAYDGNEGEDLFWFHRELGYGDDSVVYSRPVIVTIRTGNERRYRLIIDSMEDIAPFSQNEIRLFPPLLEPFALGSGMWGILPRNGKLFLLIDVLRWMNAGTCSMASNFREGKNS